MSDEMNFWENAKNLSENGGYLSTDKLSNKGKLNDSEKKAINDMGEFIIHLKMKPDVEKLWNMVLRQIDLKLEGEK